MTVELLNNAWYRLPDGTRTQARRSQDPARPNVWVLVSADGTTPLYGHIKKAGSEGFIRWEPAPGGYRITACELTLDDLTPERAN